MNTLALTMILAQVGAVPVAPVLKLEPQIQAQPGQVFVVKAENNLKWKRWTIPVGLSRVPPEHTKYGDDAFVGFGPAGVYEFRVEGTASDVHAEAKCIVFVGSPVPVPPSPGPSPSPSDQLVAVLQKAYEGDGKRPEIRDRLCRLWLDAAASVIDNDDFKTCADFRQAMHNAAPNHPYRLAPTDLLKGCREKLGEELSALCGGTEVCPLGAAKSELRLKIKALLERYAVALGACK